MQSARRGAMNPSRLGLSAVFVAILIVGGCNPGAGASSPGVPSPSSAPTATTVTSGVHGKAVAGPTCPVEPASPLPGECAPRAVGGAVLVFTDAGGHEVSRVTTAADGTFTVSLPAGSYTLTPQVVTGLMGVAPPISVTVPASGAPAELVVQYDTGIR
jgi:hypothetical protein